MPQGADLVQVALERSRTTISALDGRTDPTAPVCTQDADQPLTLSAESHLVDQVVVDLEKGGQQTWVKATLASAAGNSAAWLGKQLGGTLDSALRTQVGQMFGTAVRQPCVLTTWSTCTSGNKYVVGETELSLDVTAGHTAVRADGKARFRDVLRRTLPRPPPAHGGAAAPEEYSVHVSLGYGAQREGGGGEGELVFQDASEELSAGGAGSEDWPPRPFSADALRIGVRFDDERFPPATAAQVAEGAAASEHAPFTNGVLLALGPALGGVAGALDMSLLTAFQQTLSGSAKLKAENWDDPVPFEQPPIALRHQCAVRTAKRAAEAAGARHELQLARLKELGSAPSPASPRESPDDDDEAERLREETAAYTDRQRAALEVPLPPPNPPPHHTHTHPTLTHTHTHTHLPTHTHALPTPLWPVGPPAATPASCRCLACLLPLPRLPPLMASPLVSTQAAVKEQERLLRVRGHASADAASVIGKAYKLIRLRQWRKAAEQMAAVDAAAAGAQLRQISAEMAMVGFDFGEMEAQLKALQGKVREASAPLEARRAAREAGGGAALPPEEPVAGRFAGTRAQARHAARQEARLRSRPKQGALTAM